MYKLVRCVTLFALLFSSVVFLDPGQCRADEATPTTPFGRMVHGLNPANWKMPTFSGLLPQQEEKARLTKKKDSLVDEVGQTASNSWNRTKTALNPQRLNPVRFFTASAATPATPTQQEQKPGFFSSLFSPSAPPEKTSTTTSDFLSQPRPTP